MSTTDKYGHFDEQGRYVITNPNTPEPWLHYLIRPEQPGTETFCSGVSYAGGGFDVRGTHENTFVDTQLHLNDADGNGRYVLIKDKKSGELFSNRESGGVLLRFGGVERDTVEESLGSHARAAMVKPDLFHGLFVDVGAHHLFGDPFIVGRAVDHAPPAELCEPPDRIFGLGIVAVPLMVNNVVVILLGAPISEIILSKQSPEDDLLRTVDVGRAGNDFRLLGPIA